MNNLPITGEYLLGRYMQHRRATALCYLIGRILPDIKIVPSANLRIYSQRPLHNSSVALKRENIYRILTKIEANSNRCMEAAY